MNIYFCGMIGTGKTTLGKQVAQRLGKPFYDLDSEMDNRLGYSFHRLVEEEGWLAFRELEYSICKSFASRQYSVICLGGGTVRYEWNRDALRGSGVTVLLEVSIPEIVRRVRQADRPRVHSGTSLEEDVRIMWSRFGKTYRSAADVIYRAEGKSVKTEVDELVELVAGDPRFALVRREPEEGSRH